MKLIKKLCVLSDGSLKPMYVHSFLNPSFNKATKKDSRCFKFNQKKGAWEGERISHKQHKTRHSLLKK